MSICAQVYDGCSHTCSNEWHDGAVRGGYGSSDHGTLAERVARSRGAGEPGEAAAPPPAQPSPAAFVDSPSPARHCRVDGEPALLVEWCRTERGWEGRVVSVAWIDGEGWATVARWLPASRIVPVP